MMINIPTELVEQFARGNGVIFVGGGLSQGAGLPSWADLVRDLATELDGCPPDTDPRDIAQYYDNEHNRNRLVQRLRDQLDTTAVQPTPVHEALARLPVSAIFTTNYDDLLEKALRTTKRPFTPVIGNVDTSFWSADRLQLVKLHGDLNQPKSIVITAEDYERFATQHPALARLLAATLQTRTVLFLGYSATDPDLRLILTQVRDESGRFARNLYTVQFSAPQLTTKDLERRGLKVIDLGPQPDGTARNIALHEWLQALKHQVTVESQKLKPVAPQEPQTAAEMLASEIKIWLNAMGYTVISQPGSDSYIDLDATLQRGLEEQHVLVRCIAGEITVRHLETLEQNIAERSIPKGWAVSDRCVPPSVLAYADTHSTIRPFSLTSLVSKIFGPYFENLRKLVEESDIHRYYVDLACHRLVFDQDGNQAEEDSYEVVDTYVDDWLKARDASHLSILGESGAGKTWFCRHYAYRQLIRYLNDPVHERLPILITLRDYAKQIDVGSLIRKLLDEQGVYLSGGFEAFQALNKQGKLLLIFDGFDEMALKVDYQTVVDYFWELAKVVVPGSRALLTCRTGYFRHATEAGKIMHGEELGREMIIVQPPKFEVVYIDPFSDQQIQEIVTLQRDAHTAQLILSNPNLKDLAQQPVLVEILLHALPDIGADISSIDMNEVYRLAVERWLERDIRTGRTFMSKWDKLFFMSELAWQMISTSNLKIHYKELANHINHHFGLEKRDELDHYDYDIRTKSFLRRDVSGNYEFMHKSFAEYFTAFKFALESKSVATEYIVDIPQQLKSLDIAVLKSNLGALPLTKMPEVADFWTQMVGHPDCLVELVKETQHKKFEEVGYIGSNAVSVLSRVEGYSLQGLDLSNTVLVQVDLTGIDLSGVDFRNADMRRAEMRFTVYDGKRLDGEPLHKYVYSCSLFKGADLDGIDWHLTHSYRFGGSGCFPAGMLVKMFNGKEKPIEKVQIGDQLLSYCVETGSFAPGSVVETFEGEAFSYIVVNEQLMITPSESAFTGEKWARATLLQEGDHLFTLEGATLIQTIEQVQQRVNIFNLTVHPHHNFFANSTLVHNWTRVKYG